MCLAARPGQIVETQCWDLIIPSCTTAICAHVLLAEMMDTIHRVRKGSTPMASTEQKGVRITGSDGRNYHPGR